MLMGKKRSSKFRLHSSDHQEEKFAQNAVTSGLVAVLTRNAVAVAFEAALVLFGHGAIIESDENHLMSMSDCEKSYYDD